MIRVLLSPCICRYTLANCGAMSGMVTCGVMPSAITPYSTGTSNSVRPTLIAPAGSKVVANRVDLVGQAGGITGLKFPRTEGLGNYASMAELRATGALPGEQGVIITDRTVRFGDVYELGAMRSDKIEFSLVTERVDGALVKKLYSGSAWTSPVPRDARLIGHVHPNENAFKMWPSTQDMDMVNTRYFRDLMANPNADPLPTRIFWGPGNTDNTIFYPGFGKTELTGQGG